MVILQSLISVDRKEFYNDKNHEAVRNFKKKNPLYTLKESLTSYELG